MRESQGTRGTGMSPFQVYLRTGRSHSAEPQPIQLKFNPWHDPANGRFTFARRGTTAVPAREGRAWSGGGVTGGGRGRGGGAGASGSWSSSAVSKHRSQPDRTLRHGPAATVRSGRAPARPRAELPEGDHIIVRNGYRFHIDGIGRTREVTGTVVLGQAEQRSRAMQRQAGGKDRLPRDDGGHYIAVRFRGPREVYNHFAQNRGINRGRYRILEDRWAKAVKRGSHVLVAIGPTYVGTSKRPDGLFINTSIDGHSTPEYVSNHAGIH